MSSERLQIHTTPLADLKWLARKRLGDERGFLQRLFCAKELTSITQGRPIQQINHTHTRAKGTVRGIHFRHAPHDEIKMVSCLKGAILDVAVDLRASSETFLSWHAEELSAENNKALLIPEGFAHGFQVLEKESELLYLHSEQYTPQLEDGLSPMDPRLSIPWPLLIAEMSDRDRGFPILTDKYKGLSL